MTPRTGRKERENEEQDGEDEAVRKHLRPLYFAL